MLSNQTLKVAVLVSGNGSNLQVLIDKMQSSELPIQIVGVISNKADAYALERAKKANITTAIIVKNTDGKKLTRIGFETQALAQLKDWQADLVVLAGFMRILTPLFIDGVSNNLSIPMINLHPSLLPNYKGLDTHKRVLKSGETLHGCSVHLVNSELDAGEVIAQAVTAIKHNDSVETLQNRVHTLEHQLLPMVVGLFAKGLLKVENSKLSNDLGVNLPFRLLF